MQPHYITGSGANATMVRAAAILSKNVPSNLPPMYMPTSSSLRSLCPAPSAPGTHYHNINSSGWSHAIAAASSAPVDVSPLPIAPSNFFPDSGLMGDDYLDFLLDVPTHASASVTDDFYDACLASEVPTAPKRAKIEPVLPVPSYYVPTTATSTDTNNTIAPTASSNLPAFVSESGGFEELFLGDDLGDLFGVLDDSVSGCMGMW